MKNERGTKLVVMVVAVLCGWWTSEATIITGETAVHSADDTLSINFPINAVDNSGITINSPDLVTNGAIEHNAGTNGDGWVADPTVGTALGVTLTIDLGLVYDRIDGMRVWNFNGSAGTDHGLQTYDLETSANGSSWTLQQNDQSLAVALNIGDVPTDNAFDGVYTSVDLANVRFVRFTAVDTYRSGDDRAGLSEVMCQRVHDPGAFDRTAVRAGWLPHWAETAAAGHLTGGKVFIVP